MSSRGTKLWVVGGRWRATAPTCAREACGLAEVGMLCTRGGTVIRAMLHKWLNRNASGHRLWHEDMIWTGGKATVWFCTCGQ